MGKEELSYAEILQIVELFRSSPELSEFHLKFGITELDLHKPGSENNSTAAAPRRETSAVARSGEVPASPPDLSTPPVPAEQPKARSVSKAAPLLPRAFPIKALTVGTFYCAPAPGAKPFVSIGERVTPDTTICIIEVMKLMNSIQAGCSGVVSEVLAKDAEPVEFGQTLMLIELD